MRCSECDGRYCPYNHCRMQTAYPKGHPGPISYLNGWVVSRGWTSLADCGRFYLAGFPVDFPQTVLRGWGTMHRSTLPREKART